MVRAMNMKASERAAAPAPGEPASQGRQRFVNTVFDRVAGRYDLMNDLMSGGLHRIWKSLMVEWLAPPLSSRRYEVLDVAGGTGDIAFRIIDRGGSGVRVTLSDINPSMTAVSAERACQRGIGDQIGFVTANAQALSFEAASFDAYTIAFGIRNVPDIPAALGEAYRVLRPGGRFLCLEFSNVDMPVLDRVYQAYSDAVIPKLGAMIVGEAEPYRYLVDSIARFPDRETFAGMIREAGFGQVQVRALSGGIVALHSGWRL